MSAFAHRVQRALTVPMLCGVLLSWQHTPLVAYQQDRPDRSATLPEDAVADPGLATLEVATGDEDRDRLY